jgi:fatty-acid peroxygenase
MTLMFERAASIGPPYREGLAARRRSDAWAADLVRGVREGRIEAPEGSALATLALWRDGRGERLSPEVAAVELLSILRPTIAVAYFVVFAADALRRHPETLREGEDPTPFVQEVRRLAPFFPMLAAMTRHGFEWKGMDFPGGCRVVLDVLGTNRDPAVWEDPEAFRPERFAGREPGPYDMIPQGGGGHERGHRCAGEWMTLGLMRRATVFLRDRLETGIAGGADDGDGFAWTSIPALPRAPVVLRRPRLVRQAA